MSVVLDSQKKSELPLIAFTTCVPAALGVTLCSLLVGGGFMLAAFALLLATVGMVASVAHLAKPLRAPRALTNLRTSWLSREIAVVGAFWGCLALWTASSYLRMEGFALAFQVLSGLVGIPLLYVIARAYHVSTRPAWCGSEGLLELWATACGVGASVAMLCAQNMACACVLAGIGLIGFGIDMWSHPARKARLTSRVGLPDQRVEFTLAHYEKLWPLVRRLYVAEGYCVILLLAVAVLKLSGPLADAIMAVAILGQLLVHGAHRDVFYELPVQVRWVQKLRK